jgi:2-polyprenyl-6-methoxyphenol hydroxylase-like FAD-dependent oxidoreductase
MDVIIIGAGVGGMTLGLGAPSAASQCFHCERSSRPVVCRVSAALVKVTLGRMLDAACDE